jgi:6-phosphogluconate dehydrogenase
MSAEDIADVFDEWNRGELDSYLIEITREVLRETDPETGKPMVDVILDAAGQKGTGKWTSQNALDIGAPTPTVAEAVFARCVSALKEERVAASKILRGPATNFTGNRSEFLADIGKALYASKICSYAQGFQLLEMAGREYGWDLRHGDIALMWRGGCIIRAKFLEDIKKAFDDDPELPNLLLAPFFKNAIDEAQDSWRNVVASAARMGIPVPAFASALAYYDSYRSERLPANLIQAQRDYFGAHTYERIDRPRGEFFHTDWSRD